MIMIHRLTRAFLLIAITVIPLSASAAWQVSKADSSLQSDPFFQGARPRGEIQSPSPVAHNIAPMDTAGLESASAVYAVSISGSLKENLERIMGRYHWRVVWKAPYDYNFDGRVTGTSLPNVVEKLLNPFPLQAVMYMANRTIAIVPKYTA